jgi:serine phosphatase RsbU (regulator of sigma subunit)
MQSKEHKTDTVPLAEIPGGPASQSRAGRLKKLIEAGRALAEVESVEEILPILLRMAQDVTDSSASSILLYKEDKDILEFALALNEDKDGVQKVLKSGVALKVGEGIAGWVAENKKSVIVRDAATDPRFYKKADKATGFVTRSLLCTPILHGERLLGVVQCLNSKSGNSFEDEDLELLESFADMASVAIVRSELLQVRIREQKLKSQLDAAARIQANIRPKNPPFPVKSKEESSGAYGIWGESLPAVFVGGDLYDFIPLDNGDWIVTIADVSGKGLPAALVMVALWSRLRALVKNETRPGPLMERWNQSLCEIMSGEIFATAVILLFSPGQGTVKYALAGHLPPLLVGTESCVEMKGLKGRPLGIEYTSTYDEAACRLESGESLLLLTDGVQEARNDEGAFFEDQGVFSWAEGCKKPPRGSSLLQCVDAWRGAAAASDDTTIIEIWKQ